nr:retrovirus-related Pol polyprotein from transposon TNT 1-94 [Tanacetum cinerariifolium]
MWIEKYFLMIDYSLWEVIFNGDSPVPTRLVEGVVQLVALTSAEQKLARKNELKAHDTLLMALPDKHQLKFNSHKDAKILMEAINKQFEWKTKTKKFEIHGVSLSQEDVNLKFLIEEQSLDDLFNSLKIYKAEVKNSSSTGTTTQNLAFVSSSNTDSTTDSVSAPASVSGVCAKLPASSLSNVDSLKIDLRWQMAMLTMRARRFLQKVGINLGDNGPTSMGFDMSKVECYNCHRKGHFARECRSPEDSRRSGVAKPQRRTVPVDTSTSNALVSQCDGLESVEARLLVYKQNESVFEENIKLLNIKVQLRDTALITLRKKLEKADQERDDLKLKLENFETSSKNLTELLASQTNEKHGSGYYSQCFSREMFDCENYFSSKSNCESCPPSSLNDRLQPSGGYHDLSPSKPAQDLSHKNRPTTPIIEDWVSNSEDESETKASQIVPSFIKSFEQVKTPRHSMKPVETSIPAATPKPTLLTQSNPISITAVRPALVISAPQGNMSYLSEFKELNGGYVAFGGNPKGGKISSKGKIKTATKDETSPIIKTFITGLENQLSLKVKVIISDNGTEFKNSDLNQFCRMKGIKREISVPRTPQQNGINRVLVTKPYKKTLYELLHGKPPSIGLMRPFGCPVTILNTLDSLGKFKGKVDEGFLVGYSVNSKAFRVFNSRTRIVQETLHVNFLENKPNIAGSGPTWLFDIDSLTITMNYQPVTAGNQTNSSNYDGDAAFDEKEHDIDAKKPKSEVILSPSSSAQSRKQDDQTKKEAKGKSPVESFIGYRDLSIEFEDCSENNSNEEEPKRVHQALKDPSWIEAIKEELLQFKMQKVWVLVDLPHVKRAIGTKWVYRNKKDERGIVVRNKARLVAQGHTQEEIIDYEEVFAPVARIEAIRLFLVYASFIGFMVYQMDVKSAFPYETIEEEVYVCQPLGFEDPDLPEKVHKVVKVLGLHQAPRAWKFGLTEEKSANTLIDTEKPLLKDPDGEDVDVHT